MKKSIIVLFALMMLSFMSLPAFAAEAQVVVDGQAVVFADQQPYIDRNDRTMVPLRAPMEALGANVDWNAENRQAIIAKDDTLIVFTIDSNIYTVNGVAQEMDTQAVISGGRTCIPIRFAAEAIGTEVTWDEETDTVEITTAKVDEEVNNSDETPVNNEENPADENVAEEENTAEETIGQDENEEEITDQEPVDNAENGTEITDENATEDQDNTASNEADDAEEF